MTAHVVNEHDAVDRKQAGKEEKDSKAEDMRGITHGLSLPTARFCHLEAVGHCEGGAFARVCKWALSDDQAGTATGQDGDAIPRRVYLELMKSGKVLNIRNEN